MGRVRSESKCNFFKGNASSKCKYHGDLSTGPKTANGKQRCADVKTIHGFETRQIRKERSEGLTRLYELETLGRKIGLIQGEWSRGPKPKGFKGED